MVIWGIVIFLSGNWLLWVIDGWFVVRWVVLGLGFLVVFVVEFFVEYFGMDGDDRCGFIGDVWCGWFLCEECGKFC